jgi:Ca-activated chloride channel family protein
MIFAAARPVWPIPLPDNKAAIMLAMDVSGSMIATDVYPSRMEAAKKTATEFVRALPAGAKVGLVSFSTFATIVVFPTEDHDRVIAALAGLHPQASTAIGDGLLKAVYALPGRAALQTAQTGDPPVAASQLPAPAGVLQKLPPAAIVLMSDGGNNAGTSPDKAAAVAHRLHVTVHTVGLGAPPGIPPDTAAPATPATPDSEALDEPTLKRIAGATEGTYHRAGSAEELSRTYTGLGRMIGWKQSPQEVSGLVSTASAGLLGVTLLVSAVWRRLD